MHCCLGIPELIMIMLRNLANGLHRSSNVKEHTFYSPGRAMGILKYIHVILTRFHPEVEASSLLCVWNSTAPAHCRHWTTEALL